MPCFSCKCFRDGRGRNGECLSGGRGWCELWDQEYYRGHECRKFAPQWVNPSTNKKNRSAMKEPNGCFLTTACMQHKGLPDDCIELTELRQFRDTVLRATDEGQKLVDEYYRIAPSIVERIEQATDKDAICESIYQTVQRCLDLIRMQQYDQAITRYRDMVYELQSKLT